MDNAEKCLRDMLEHLGINSSDVEFMELKKTDVINTGNKEANDGTL